MKGFFHSLTFRILLPLCCIGMILSLLATSFIHQHLEKEMELIVQRRVETLSDVIGFFLDASGNNPNILQRVVESIGTEQDVRLIAVVSGGSESVVASSQLSRRGVKLDQLPPDTSRHISEALKNHRASMDYSSDDSQLLQYYQPLRVIDRSSPGKLISAVVTIHIDLQAVHAEVDQQYWSVLGFFILSILWLCLSVFMLFRTFIFDRIHHLQDVIERRAGGDNDAVAKDAYEDEIGDVALALNNMLSTIDRTHNELERFTYIASHDMRSPIVNLRGFTGEIRHSFETLRPLIQRVTDKLPEDDQALVGELLSDDIPESLNFIKSSVERLELYTDSIMKLSRLGRRELSFEAVDLNTLVRGILDSLQHQIESLNILIEVDPLPTVEADLFCMQQVFGNLIDNAIKYHDPKRPCFLTISAREEDEHWAITVSDTGKGIPEMAQKRIFELFNRGACKDGEGDGMGLTVVRTLVRRHKGEITCKSEPGMGTTFTVYLRKELRRSGFIQART